MKPRRSEQTACSMCAGKLKDKKTGPAVIELFDAMAFGINPWFVVSRLFTFAQDSKVCVRA